VERQVIKFVVLGHRRSGSTLLLCDLLVHRNVYMFGELFNESEDERRRAFVSGLRGCTVARRRGIDENRFYRDGQDAAAFLKNLVFYDHYWEPVAVGFKLLYHQARNDENGRHAWDYLVADKDIRVIRLVRHNMLESMLSLRIAYQTNEWARLKNETESPVAVPAPMHLSPEECEDYFNQIEQSQEWARNMFSDHRLLEVDYESDLCRGFQNTMHRIHDFLEVPRRRARKMLQKQARRTPAEQIRNYQQLKAHFAATPYAGWFQ